MFVPFSFDRDFCYLIKEQDEVDGKAHKESQETEVVEVTSQVVLLKYF